jgi:hypothetical protein
MLEKALSRFTKQSASSTVGAMNQAATQDLRTVVVWPAIKAMLAHGTSPSARDTQMVALLDAWLNRGASRLDGDLDGKIDDPGAAVMDAMWPILSDAVLAPRLGTLTNTLATLMTRSDNPDPGGSSFGSGWYGYVKDDLSAPTPFYCGAGDVGVCATSLWHAIDAAGDQLQAAQGSDPAAWHADANAERIRFVPGLLGKTMRWTNRPTFQQVISFARHRPRG